jgi:hypothetical protein
MNEYTPERDESRDGGGRGEDYAAMLLAELKPAIDARYRTQPDDVSVGGSSLGGLFALHLALRRSDVVRRAAAISPSVWWKGRAILEAVDALPPGPRPAVWLDIGGREGREAIRDVRLLRDRMAANGWNETNFNCAQGRCHWDCGMGSPRSGRIGSIGVLAYSSSVSSDSTLRRNAVSGRRANLL